MGKVKGIIKNPDDYYKLARKLLNKFKRMVNDDCFEDMVQEYAIAMWKYGQRAEEGRPGRAYQYKCAYGKSLTFLNNVYKRFTNRHALIDPTAYGSSDCESSWINPPTEESNILLLEYREINRQILSAIDDLENREKTIIVERFKNGKTLREIGRKLGLCRERVRQIEKETLESLKLKLESLGINGSILTEYGSIINTR